MLASLTEATSTDTGGDAIPLHMDLRALATLRSAASAGEPEATSLRRIIELVADRDLYIPAVTQEARLALFAGHDLCVALAEAMPQGWRQAACPQASRSSGADAIISSSSSLGGQAMGNTLAGVASPLRRQPESPCAPHSSVDSGGSSSMDTGAIPDFRTDPDAEVAWWCEQLLRTHPDRQATFWQRLPTYTQYIMHSTLETILDDTIRGVMDLESSRLGADDAMDLPVQLGSIMPLPLAVYARFARCASAKPEYFTTDITYTLLASVLHKDLVVRPMPQDDSVRIRPRFWCTPTADTTAGKSPCLELLRDLFVDCIRRNSEHWYENRDPTELLYSDGSHGGFNEKMRMSQGVVAFISPEATNQLSPDFPTSGRVDQKYLQM